MGSLKNLYPKHPNVCKYHSRTYLDTWFTIMYIPETFIYCKEPYKILFEQGEIT